MTFNFSIQKKFLLLAILPILLLLLISFLLFNQLEEEYDTAEEYISVREYQIGLLKLIYALQTERGSVALLKTSYEDRIKLLVQESTDEVDVKLLGLLHQFEDTDSQKLYGFNTDLIAIHREVKSLRKLHLSVIDLDVDMLFRRYTSIINKLRRNVYLHPFKGISEDDEELFATLREFEHLQLIRGEKRAFVGRILASENYDEDLFTDFSNLYAADKNLRQQMQPDFKRFESALMQEKSQMVDMRIDDIAQMIEEFHHTFWGGEIEKEYASLKAFVGIRPDVWFNLMSTQMQTMQSLMYGELQKRIDLDRRHLAEHREGLIFGYVLLGIFLFIILILVFGMSKKIIDNIKRLKVNMQSFFDYMTHKEGSINTLEIDGHDELRDMSEYINRSVENIVIQNENDNAFLKEVTGVVSDMYAGKFDQRLFFEPTHPALKVLKEKINSMLDVIETKIKATTLELEINNANLEKEVEIKFNELKQIEQGIDDNMIVFELDTQDNIINVNRGCVRRLDIPKEELIGQPFVDFLSSDNKSKSVMKTVNKRLEEMGVYSTYLELMGYYNKKVYLDASFQLLKNLEGKEEKKLVLCNDVTQIVNARKKAEEAERAKGDFLANMSHEIRTPLNAILGFIDILEKTVHDAKPQRYIKVIQTSSQSLLGIINDILDFSKIKSGVFKINPSDFSPMEEIGNVIELHASKMHEKKILFLPYLDVKLPAKLHGDSLRIKQIISNILSNAAKFTPEAGEVKLSVQYKDGMLICKIQDNGIGMTKEQQQRVFSAFEQADSSTTREFGGTGLGLAISSSLATMMNGSISVSSEPGVGTTFTLSLPLKIIEERGTFNTDMEKVANTTVAFLPFDEKFIDVERLIKHYLHQLGVEQISDVSNEEELYCCQVLIGSMDKIDVDGINAKAQYTIGVMLDGESEMDNSASSFLYPLSMPFTPKSLLEVLDDATEANLRVLEEPASATEQLHFSGRLLIAEDNKTNQMLISLLMDEYGLDYELVDNGEEAYEKYLKNDYDLVFMDINMPVMDGVEATKKIREYEQSTSKKVTPIIALTANVMSEDKEIYEQAGMDAHLAKPIENEALDAVLQQYLEKV